MRRGLKLNLPGQYVEQRTQEGSAPAPMRRGLKPCEMADAAVTVYRGSAPAPMRRGLKLPDRQSHCAKSKTGSAPAPMRRGLKRAAVRGVGDVIRSPGSAPAPMRRGLKHERGMTGQEAGPTGSAPTPIRRGFKHGKHQAHRSRRLDSAPAVVGRRKGSTPEAPALRRLESRRCRPGGLLHGLVMGQHQMGKFQWQAEAPAPLNWGALAPAP